MRAFASFAAFAFAVALVLPKAAIAPRGSIQNRLANVIKNYYIQSVTSSEFKRWLRKQGVTFTAYGKGSHQRAYLNGKVTTFPNHPSKEIPTGTVNAIKRDLGLK